MKEKILVTIPNFSEEAKSLLGELGEVVYFVPTQEELDQMIGEYTVLIVGLGVTFYRKTLEQAKHLKVLATATTGLDHIDLRAAKETNIAVLSLKDETEFLDTITGTAELAFGLMVSLYRMIPEAYESVVHRGEWRREDYRGQSLYGKTLGIVGLGRLGKIMARGAAGFRMNVMFCDPAVPQTAFPEYKKVSFEELLKESDVVSIHVHLTKDTENMFAMESLTKMKHSAYLINTARGKIVHEPDLIEALENGTIQGYASDVLANELDYNGDVSADSLVSYARTHRNVILVPHIGGMTADSRAATDLFIAKNTCTYLQTT